MNHQKAVSIAWIVGIVAFFVVKANLGTSPYVDPSTTAKAAMKIGFGAGVVAYLLCGVIVWAIRVANEDADRARTVAQKEELEQAVSRSELLKAIRHGDASKVAQALASGADPDQTTLGGVTALMLAAQGGILPVLEMLLDAGASLEKVNDAGETALFDAVAHGHGDATELLLQRGAAVNKVSINGFTPLVCAVKRRDNVGSLRSLLDRGANVHHEFRQGETTWTPIGIAAAASNAEAVLALIRAGVNPKQRSSGMPPLYFAVYSDSLATVRAFIENGVDTRSEVNDRSMIAIAEDLGRHEIARYLRNYRKPTTLGGAEPTGST